MTNEKKFYTKINIDELEIVIFWVGMLFVLISEVCLEMGFQNTLTGGIVKKVGLALLALKILSNKDFWIYSTRDKLFRIIPVLCGIATYMKTGYDALLIITLAIVAANGIKYKDLCKFYLIILGALFLINIVLIITGIKTQTILEVSGTGHYRNRYDLGFIHPNRAMDMYVNSIFCCMLFVKDKISKYMWMISIIPGAIVFYITDARSGMLALLSVLFFLMFTNTKIDKWLMKIQYSKIIYSISIVAMIMLGIVFNGKRLIKIKALNTYISRIMGWGRARKAVGFSLFGKVWDDSFPIDCGFYRTLFLFGILGFLLLVSLFFIVMEQRKNDFIFCAVIVGMCVLNIFGARMLSIIYTLPLLTLFAGNDEIYCEEKYKSNHNLKCINVMVFVSIISMVIGHSILQSIFEKGAVIQSDTTNIFRVVDLVLIVFGLVTGNALYRIWRIKWSTFRQ